jgi:hypothetical protein
VSKATAGKGPGIVIQSRTGSGAVRLAPREAKNQAVLELLDNAGGITQIRMSPDELRRLAAQMNKVAGHLEAVNNSEEVTQP